MSLHQLIRRSLTHATRAEADTNQPSRDLFHLDSFGRTFDVHQTAVAVGHDKREPARVRVPARRFTYGIKAFLIEQIVDMPATEGIQSHLCPTNAVPCGVSGLPTATAVQCETGGSTPR